MEKLTCYLLVYPGGEKFVSKNVSKWSGYFKASCLSYHIFVEVPPKYSQARVVQIMKSISAREVFKQFPDLRKRLWAGELWSDGYFVRSVGDKVTADIIRRYIEYQAHEDDSQLKLNMFGNSS